MRATMAPIVGYIRKYGQVGTTEVFNGVTYWTDDQLEELCDERAETMNVWLRPITNTIYKVKVAPQWAFETPAFYSAGGTLLTGTYNDDRREVTFSTAPSTDVYVVAAAYPRYAILADLWGIKAAQRQDYVTIKGGNNRLDMVQEREFCEKQRDYYRNRIMRGHRR
jgi:hypothetical protein